MTNITLELLVIPTIEGISKEILHLRFFTTKDTAESQSVQSLFESLEFLHSALSHKTELTTFLSILER